MAEGVQIGIALSYYVFKKAICTYGKKVKGKG
jgi:hypothetical protein